VTQGIVPGFGGGGVGNRDGCWNAQNGSSRLLAAVVTRKRNVWGLKDGGRGASLACAVLAVGCWKRRDATTLSRAATRFDDNSGLRIRKLAHDALAGGVGSLRHADGARATGQGLTAERGGTTPEDQRPAAGNAPTPTVAGGATPDPQKAQPGRDSRTTDEARHDTPPDAKGQATPPSSTANAAGCLCLSEGSEGEVRLRPTPRDLDRQRWWHILAARRAGGGSRV